MGSSHILRFSGGDPTCWILDVQEYFDYVMCPDADRLYFVGMLFDDPSSEWFYNYRRANPDCSWQNFLDAVFQKFHPALILAAEIEVKLKLWANSSKIKLDARSTQALESPMELSTAPSLETSTDSSTKFDLEPSVELSITSSSVIETVAKNDNESQPQVLVETMVEYNMVETKFPPKFHSPKLTIVVIGYVTEVAEEISCQNTVSPSLGGVPSDTILFANEDQNNDNETEIDFSDFHLEGKVVFNRGGVDRDLDFYFIPEVS